MANWCQHQLFFTGEKSALENVFNAFKKMQEYQIKNYEGRVPDFMVAPESEWFFTVVCNELPTEQISYETKWSDNVVDLVTIADHYGVSFEVEYQESGCNIYGKASYNHKTKELKQTDLDDSDFEQFGMNEEGDIYFFRDKEYECETDILDILLAERELFKI